MKRLHLSLCLMAFILAIPVFFISYGLSEASDDGYVHPSLVRVFYTDKADIKALSDAGACIVSSGPGWIDVIVSSQPVKGDPVDELIGKSSRVDVIEENLDLQAEKLKGKANLGLYHTFEEAVDQLKGYERDYSDVAKLHVIGKSLEGRNVYALKISDNVASDEGEPGFFICSMHHSREWISVEVPLALADKILTTYKTDPAMRKLVESREIWIVPVQNPDGYVWSTTKYKMWRKNRRPNGGSSYGVDPNRNYSFEWGGAGASTNPGSDTYRGPSAASEPCTQIVERFAKEHKNLVGSISFHSYGDLILWPWSYTYDAAPDDQALGKIAKAMAKLNRYSPKQSSDLYPSSGDYDDYMYGACGIASFTIELARSFIPNESEIAPICEKNVKALLWFIENCSNPFPALRHTELSATTSEGPYDTEVALNKSALGGGVDKLVLNHSFNDGNFKKIAMKASSSDKYVAAIPGSGQGKVGYFFEGKGKNGKSIRFPQTGEFTFDVVSSLYLLVDDDKGRKFEEYYVEALKDSGYPVSVHDRASAPVTLAQLHSASAVIWFVGSDSSDTLSSEDKKVLTSYLENGGKLLIMGQDLGYGLKKDKFYKNVMKAKFVSDTSKVKKLAGNSGTFLDGFTFSVEGNSSEGQQYPEVVSPLDGAFVIASYTDGKGAAVGVDSDKCRIAYFGVGLEGIDGAPKRAEFMKRTLEWLEGSVTLSAREGLVLDTLSSGSDNSRELALSGAALTDKMIDSVLVAAEDGNYEYIRGFIANDTRNGNDYRVVLRQLFRKLSMDERAEAAELCTDVKAILSK